LIILAKVVDSQFLLANLSILGDSYIKLICEQLGNSVLRLGGIFLINLNLSLVYELMLLLLSAIERLLARLSSLLLLHLLGVV
jgi:hypothetical protein